MSDDLRERVARAMRILEASADNPPYNHVTFEDHADAAISLILEEAARVAARMHRKGQIGPDIAAAIRSIGRKAALGKERVDAQ